MGKKKLFKLCAALCLALSMLLLPPAVFHAQAAEAFATVEGTVQSGTTADFLKLSTKEGNMEIKINSSTDISACKILLPDQKVSVSVAYSNDGYLHATKISSSTQSTGITIDSSASSTVTGTITEKTKGDLLYLNTAYGEMQIKLDTTTDMSACSILTIGKTYAITCARGSDAYMHAIRIADSSAANTTTTSTTTTSNGSTAASMTVTGTVGKNTTENLLYLSTKDGEMQFVIDSNADTSKGMILVPGNKLSVGFYHGTDGWLHAVNIAGSKDSSSVTVDTSYTSAVSGSVNSKSTENILYLDTAYGTMQFKLDNVRSLNNCKVLVNGKKITVNYTYGSDAYLHAVDITG